MPISFDISEEKNDFFSKLGLTIRHLGIKWDEMGHEPRFRGFYEHSLDDRNRLSIPSRFRQILVTLSNGEVIMTKDHDSSIGVYPLNKWEDFEDKELLPLPFNKIQARRYRRHYTFSIKEDRIDGQGRLLVPDWLIKYAGIEKGVVIIGEISYFTIWSVDNFRKFQEEINKTFPADAEDILNLRRHDETDAARRE